MARTARPPGPHRAAGWPAPRGRVALCASGVAGNHGGMPPRSSTPALVLAAVVTLLAGIAAAFGIVFRGDLTTVPFTTLRGEAIDAVTGGIYAWNALPVVSEGIGWDLVTLLLVVPAAFASIAVAARGSLRAALILAGLLAYFVYQYAEYAMFWATGPLYPLHVATFALAICALALVLAGLDLTELEARAGARFPQRGVIALSVVMIVLLFGLWLPTVIRVSIGGDVQGTLNGAQTLVVPAFDLGLLVPLGAWTAALAWRRARAGLVLGSIVVVKAVAMPLAIVAMLIVEAVTTGALQLPPIVIFLAVALLAGLVGWRLFGGIEAAPAPLRGSHQPTRPGAHREATAVR